MDDVKEIIRACGGRAGVAKALGCTVEAIDGWVVRNRIAAKYITKIVKMAKKSGLTIDAVALTGGKNAAESGK